MKDIQIFSQTNRYTVCIKPVGVSSETNGNEKDGLPYLLEQKTGCPHYTVHRLDLAVSGVMVYAKNKKTAAFLSEQIQNGGFEKEYLAVLQGEPEKDKAELVDYLFKDSRKNKTYVVKSMRKGVKEAVLSYEVISKADSKDGKLTLVSVKLKTGRTHQIRVQFSSRRTALLGDGKYGSRNSNTDIALFSSKITFSDEKGEKKSFSALPNAVYPWNLFDFCTKSDK